MRSFLFLFSVLAFLCSGFVCPALALSVDQIRFGVHPGKTRLVLNLSETAAFKVSVQENPYRLVVDLPEFDWRAPPVNGPTQAGVRSVRYGSLAPGLSRIVFEMQRPPAVQAAFTLPGAGGEPSRLVIDFALVSPAAFANARGAVYGTLKPEESGSAFGGSKQAVPAPAANSAPETVVRKPVIVVDPGHGGVDPGALGPRGIMEKNVAMALAKELRKQLEDSGRYRVLLTREHDVFIKLADRVKFAHAHEADLFLSIHADSIDKPNVHGASVYSLSDKASDAQTEKLATRENRADLIAGIDLSHEDADVASILVDLAMRDTMNQSRFFAGTLVRTLQRGNIRTLDSPHRYAGFAVLKSPDIPSILVEAGFMSNDREARMLNEPTHRRKIASALKSGIDVYFDRVRKSRRP